jgi:hypothetical protein
MSFPDEPQLVSVDSITSTDVLIEDPMLEAMKGKGSVAAESPEHKGTGKTTFYSRLINALADSIHSNGRDEKKQEWTMERLKVAAEKILSIVASDDKIRRFIWKRQLPVQQYIHMTRVQTVNKISNDLLCRIRKLEASTRVDNKTSPKAAEPCPHRLQYAHSLILIVCRAIQSGQPPCRSIFCLDQAPFLHELVALRSREIKAAPLADADSSKRYAESAQERGQRLQLRQRFLACVRTKKPILSFANALLRQWNLPPVAEGKDPLPRIGDEDERDQSKGHWRAAERKTFLRALEQYSIGQWSKIASLIPTRYVSLSYYVNYCHSRENSLTCPTAVVACAQ